MNLYAIVPGYAPGQDAGSTQLVLLHNKEEALKHAIYVAARDCVEGYGSPDADVYLVAENVKGIGVAHATDAPKQWEWAHPGVEENAAGEAMREAVEDFPELQGDC